MIAAASRWGPLDPWTLGPWSDSLRPGPFSRTYTIHINIYIYLVFSGNEDQEGGGATTTPPRGSKGPRVQGRPRDGPPAAVSPVSRIPSPRQKANS